MWNKLSYTVLFLLPVVAIFLCLSCTERVKGTNTEKEAKQTEKKPEAKLIFQSGFEGSTQIVPRLNSVDDDIIGEDPDLPLSSWEQLKTEGGIGMVYINYTGGDKSKRTARITTDPVRQDNKVLHFCMKEAWPASEGQTKARIQLEFHQIKGGLKEFFQSVRVYLPKESFTTLKNYPKAIHWLTISEFWNNEWWVAGEEHGFRVTLGIGKPAGAGKDLHFILNAEDMGFVEVWNADNKDFKVPIGQWFTMNYYYKEGNKETGRFYMTVTPEGEQTQIVFDVYDFTHMTQDPSPDGVTAYNPLKLYTSKEIMDYMKEQGKPLEIYWDDLKLWKNKRP